MSTDDAANNAIPFAPTSVRPRFFPGATHDEALARLHYLAETSQRCGIVTGPSGTGKSTVLRAFTQERAGTHSGAILVDVADLGAADVLERLAERLSITTNAGGTLSSLWREVADALAGQRHAKRRCAVIFDHLDRAGADCHQVVRRLLAQESGTLGATFILAFSGRSFPIVEKEWRHAADLQIDLAPLTAEETSAFVHSLLGASDLPLDAFEPDAVAAVFAMTGGVPQAVVRLCQLALLSALHDERPSISGDVVEAAMRELSMLRSSA